MATSMKTNESTPRLRADSLVDSECKGAKIDSDVVLAFKSIQTGFRNIAAEFHDTQVATQFIQWCRPIYTPTVTPGNAAPIPKIVIAEDSPYIRRLLGTVLRAKYQILEADSGVSALQLARVHQPQLIVLDIMMPGELNGLQVLDAIKRDRKLRNIVVAMVTARDHTADVVEALKRGADTYILKPFSPCAVAAWVDSRLSSPVPLLQ